MVLHLRTPSATLRLGQILGTWLSREDMPPWLLLDGELGVGKTSLIRGLVESLPGGDAADVSSPSFNLVNIYPTRPESVHVDLYRLEGQDLDQSILDALDDERRLVAIEWAQFLPEIWRPESYLLVTLRFHAAGRQAVLQAVGGIADRCLEALTLDKDIP